MTFSKRHHYIPKFYLKGFTDSKDKFSIYDIERKVLKSKDFSTKTHFYEENRNTFDFANTKTDYLEDVYQKIEDKLKHVFLELQQALGPIQITSEKIFSIQLFIYSTYWRLPKLDGQMIELLKDIDPRKLGYKIIDTKTGKSAPDEVYKQMVSDKNFIESYRAAYPLMQFMKCDENLDLENWRIYYSKTGGKHICGDYPIVLRDTNNHNILNNEILFPLTKKQMLVRTKKTYIIKELPPEFSLKLDLIIFLQSKKYVCCSDRSYLEMLSHLKEAYKTKVSLLKNELFEYLDENN